MGLWQRIWRGGERPAPEARESIPVSSPEVLRIFGLDGMSASAAGEHVTIDSALGVPAVWAAINFLSGTLAGLSLELHRRTADGSEVVAGGLATILGEAVNDEPLSSFAWRKYFFEQVLTHGRGLTFIERAPNGRIINLWPLDVANVTIRRVEGRKSYDYREGGATRTFQASEIIDLAFMLKGDRLEHRSPLLANRNTIGLAQAVEKYAGRFFANGGVPPFVVEGPLNDPGSLTRAAKDLDSAVRKAAREQKQALVLPKNHSVKPIGADPKSTQIVELQRHLLIKIASIFALPPVFLQDLTHGTYSNTEQQDLHFAKHTLRRWVKQFEQELNLKLFGRSSNRQFVRLNIDSILRGDFKTRMEGYAVAIQNGIMTPNEARALENRPADENGDDLLIQGATVPLGSQPTQEPTESEPVLLASTEEDDEDGA